jgi:thymidylate kinase
MPIICFEGASAVGKTTTAKSFNSQFGAPFVPEVIQLFKRPDNEPPEWYFERQADRWTLACRQSRTHKLVILDGDPFQPLWYNWAYNYEGWQDLDFSARFYRAAIQNKTIDFPDLYFVFGSDETELRKRKVNDSTRSRRGFEAHLKMIEPQRRYFQAMRAFSPRRVVFLEAETIETNLEFIRARLPVLSGESEEDSEVLLNQMVGWLRENKA